MPPTPFSPQQATTSRPRLAEDAPAPHADRAMEYHRHPICDQTGILTGAFGAEGVTANLAAGFPKAIGTNAAMAERCDPIIENNDLQLFDLNGCSPIQNRSPVCQANGNLEFLLRKFSYSHDRPTAGHRKPRHASPPRKDQFGFANDESREDAAAIRESRAELAHAGAC